MDMRVYRLLAIIMILLNKNRVSASKLAKKFEVSSRTIYRDIESICQAGIPIISHQGIDGGFSILDNYKIDKNLFTAEEMTAILTALEGLNSTISDNSIKYTAEKIKTLFPENLELCNNQQIIMDLNPWERNKELKKKLELIKQAIKNSQTLTIDYINARQEISKREIEAINLVLKGTTWYLYAFCRLREDYRIFRLSRIIDLFLNNSIFEKIHKGFREYENENSWYNPGKEVHLELLFKAEALLYIQDFFAKDQIEKQADGSYLVKISYPEDNWVYGFILSFGDMVKVLTPPHIQKIIKQKAEEIYKLYN
ncbi:YafY family transcriptional regulator [Halocella sp. SP3-1]|nr:YafY family transcriptional regulator [Halocella sp. SP3-1]